MNLLKAVWVDEINTKPRIGQASALPLQDHNIQVKVAFCALNYADHLMQKGQYQESPPLPFIPGMEVSGTVLAKGSAVDWLEVGDQVAGYCGHGGMSGVATLPALGFCRVPNALHLQEAAALPVCFGTAWLGLKHLVQLQPGERVVISGASGATGIAAIQIAARLGATIIALTQGADQMARCRRHGATHVIDPTQQDVVSQVKELGRADLVFDTVGGALGEALFRTTKPGARHVLVGFSGGAAPQIKANHLLVKNTQLVGLNWPGYRQIDPDVFRASIEAVMAMAASGKIRPEIDQVFPLEEAAAAYDRLLQRGRIGKILIQP